ncbi:MAG: hypothetical protein COA70_00495 [Planctomycetota bacterium]|nr:MAG: hypothetical protein COA70_00495 [Planctomycetota bacterium]
MTELRDFLDAEYALQREESAWKGAAEKVGHQCLEDSGQSASDLRRHLAADAHQRRSLVKQWLQLLRDEGDKLPGAAMVRAHHGLGWLAVAVGTLVGLASGKAALMTTAGQPINLWLFLGILVFLQVGLLLAGFGFAAWAKIRGKAWLGFLARVAQTLFRWNWVKHHADQNLLGALQETSRVEQWVWLGFTQRFAVAFNFGAVASFVAMLMFTELQFGWSTTPDSFEPTVLTGIVDVLAAPWSWIAPMSWTPSADFVAGTRWDTLNSSFRDASADGRDWWPFLFLSLLVWGLLPRLVLLGWMQAQKRKALARLTWNHRGYQRLMEIMLPLQAANVRPLPQPVEVVTPANLAQTEVRKAILWGDWATNLSDSDLLATGSPLSLLQIQPTHFSRAGCPGLEHDATAISAAESAQPSEFWILVEAGESPDKRFTSFLGKLRGAIGKNCPMQVLPLEHVDGTWGQANQRDLEVWTRTLEGMRDRQISVSRISAS